MGGSNSTPSGASPRRRFSISGPKAPQALTADMGKDLASAQKILARRLEKAKAAWDRAKDKSPPDTAALDRARDKAHAIILLCSKWKDPPTPLTDLQLVDALFKAVWILGRVVSGDAKDPSMGYMLRAMVLMGERTAAHFGPTSWQLADIWLILAEHASAMGNWPVAVNYGQRAAALLQRLEGRELHHLPNHALVDVPWDAFGKAEFWQSGYADALDVLAHAQCKLKAREEAEDCAARHLGVLERIHGRGHVDTIPGLNSMMAAACLEGEGNIRAALGWARLIVELRVAENKGNPYCAPVAAAYENVARMFLCPGPHFSPDMAARIVDKAAQLRTGCLADMGPNAAVAAAVEEVRKARAEGRRNTLGVSLVKEGGGEEGEEEDDVGKAADSVLEGLDISNTSWLMGQASGVSTASGEGGGEGGGSGGGASATADSATAATAVASEPSTAAVNASGGAAKEGVEAGGVPPPPPPPSFLPPPPPPPPAFPSPSPSSSSSSGEGPTTLEDLQPLKITLPAMAASVPLPLTEMEADNEEILPDYDSLTAAYMAGRVGGGGGVGRGRGARPRGWGLRLPSSSPRLPRPWIRNNNKNVPLSISLTLCVCLCVCVCVL